MCYFFSTARFGMLMNFFQNLCFSYSAVWYATLLLHFSNFKYCFDFAWNLFRMFNLGYGYIYIKFLQPRGLTRLRSFRQTFLRLDFLPLLFFAPTVHIPSLLSTEIEFVLSFKRCSLGHPCIRLKPLY